MRRAGCGALLGCKCRQHNSEERQGSDFQKRRCGGREGGSPSWEGHAEAPGRRRALFLCPGVAVGMLTLQSTELHIHI